ncbi:arylsulfatase A family protein [Hoeflea sp. IMCC20628]|uniref:alkaline phosphatase family protein n=1 Tax=Hoeflea sp. IMCC20628 TaxID=1620421 RepID=UPI00063BEE33|nr:alkaline phosphatase family protein [Hoeflea sp. IMCC20628]AKI00528.1 arylsulfatase A family protein [Hoeflea sp. IMCC20628]
MNILFITADQWRGDCISALGHPLVKTPNIDRLAADGVIFKNNFGQAVPCGPARASLYTGMYLHNHGSVLNGTPLDARHTNLALEARKKGYEPALFGYTDVSLDPRSQEIVDGYEGVLPGMDPICKLLSDAAPWLDDLKQKGYDVSGGVDAVMSPQKDYPGAESKGKTYAAPVYSAEDSNTAYLVDEAIKYIAAQGDEKWFAHVSFLAPHPPFIAPEPYNSMYDEHDMPMPVRRATMKDEIAQHPWLEHYVTNQRGTALTVGSESSDNLGLSDQELRQVKATYFGMISEVDAQVGRLIEHLKAAGTYDNTLVIFTSDHGENLGDHWAFAKYTYFDQSFHVPLVIRDPSSIADKARGSVVELPTESIDIMPTLLDVLGLDVPAQCDGRSLLPFCRGGQPADWREEAHMEFDIRSPYDGKGKPPLGLEMKQCLATIVRGPRYKYIHFATLPPLLFDLKVDPNEFENLAENPKYHGVMLEFASKMLRWRVEHNAPALTDYHLKSDGAVEQGMRSR